jgi:hypothetical protein
VRTGGREVLAARTAGNDVAATLTYVSAAVASDILAIGCDRSFPAVRAGGAQFENATRSPGRKMEVDLISSDPRIW